ncbi:MAG TPA: TonB family protein [Terriglobales bacterium]|nr:TonB family protein [Terriglobales bacterium]
MSSAATPLPEEAARRRYARFPFSIPFDLTVFRPGSVIRLSGQAQDLGEGGLSGVISGPALPGERVELNLELPGYSEPLNTRAMVRHACGLQCGFEFLSLEHGQREHLQRMAANSGCLLNETEWEPGLAAPPRGDLALCAVCGQEFPEEIPVCLTCGAPRPGQEAEAAAAEPPLPAPAALPPASKKENGQRRRGPALDSVVAVVFLVTLSIGLWQWLHSPVDAEGDSQPSPVTVELENVFLKPAPSSVTQASVTAESRTGAAFNAAKSVVSAFIGSATPAKPWNAAGVPGSAASESSPRREEPSSPANSSSIASRSAAPESSPAPSSSPLNAAAGAATNLLPQAGGPPSESRSADASSAPASSSPSGSDLAGMLLQKVLPVYPAQARREGVEGQVVLKAVIGKDGTIAELRPLQGPEELTAAAIDAVQHWRFRPYELKGKPVEVETDIRLNFELPGKKQ